MPPKKRKSHGDTSQPHKVSLVDFWLIGKRTDKFFKRVATKEVEQSSETRDLDVYNKVLRTTELLESILEYLPPTTLHGIQRVNKQFQAVIISSQRVQRKMFFSIDNGPRVSWYFRSQDITDSNNDALWYLDSGSVKMAKRLDRMTAAKINPSLERLNEEKMSALGFREDVKRIVARGETLRLRHGMKFSLQHIYQPRGIMDTYLSDPHCPDMDVDLCFAIGVKLPTLISVSTVVRSSTPMTIGAIIATALNTNTMIHIKWRKIDGHIDSPGSDERRGVPRDLIDELKRQTGHAGLETYLKTSESSFRLWHFLAPSKAQEAAANMGRKQRTILFPTSSGGELDVGLL